MSYQLFCHAGRPWPMGPPPGLGWKIMNWYVPSAMASAGPFQGSTQTSSTDVRRSTFTVVGSSAFSWARGEDMLPLLRTGQGMPGHSPLEPLEP
eukprot:CAMPEP_0175527232 /NCGR_PEP_ID=MMETSP0096-20121207/20021_1 /TAXON_ID=311494 /ORGANISM="Alexandrium monilatum, Strain CCMP3105" /LENGTH=93 /DNA_ID=CAMNT_0016829879 /DNA_START=208 /DNA_END=486 /DNA_ORIENTATION=-